MTEDQLRRYLENGLAVDVQIRSRVVPPGEVVGYSVTFSEERFAASGVGGAIITPCTLYREVLATGIVGQEQHRRRGGTSMQGQFVIPGTASAGPGGVPSVAPIPSGAWEGRTVRAFVETQITLTDQSGDLIVKTKPRRFEQDVRLLPPGESVVRVVTDPAAADAVRDAVRIRRLEIRAPDAEQPRWWRAPLGSFTANLAAPEELGIAGRLFLMVGSSEVEFGAVSIPAGSASQRIKVSWYAQGDAQAALEAARAIAESGVADFIFRTDASVANNDPRISEVLDLTLILRGVPLHRPPPDADARRPPDLRQPS